MLDALLHKDVNILKNSLVGRKTNNFNHLPDDGERKNRPPVGDFHFNTVLRKHVELTSSQSVNCISAWRYFDSGVAFAQGNVVVFTTKNGIPFS